MKTRTLSITGLLVLALSLLSTSAMAGLIKSGDKLGYDQNTNLMWYTAFDLSGSYFNTYDVLSVLPSTAELNGHSVFLSWSLASVHDVNTLDFTNKTVFETFYDAPASSMNSHKIFGGFTRETLSDTMQMYSTSIDVPHALWVNRGVYYDAWADTLDWYDDYVAGHNGGAGYSDPWIDLLQANVGTFWLVANVHSVPEPSTVVLLLAGLLGLGLARRKIGQ